jgi:hypothetical protein
MQTNNEFDEFAWIEEQEKGVRLSIENLHAEIEAYQRQLAALREQRVRASFTAGGRQTLSRINLR